MNDTVRELAAAAGAGLADAKLQLVCQECGAAGYGTCGCANPVYVRAGQRAAQIAAANPTLSNVAVAKLAGVDEATVRRHRKKASTSANAEVGSTSKRTGRDGRQRRNPVSTAGTEKSRQAGDASQPRKATKAAAAQDNGPRIHVPEGQTLAERIREGMRMEEGGATTRDTRKHLGMGEDSYRQGRVLVLLGDRNDLGAADVALVHKALALMNEERRTRPAWLSIRHVEKKVFGKGQRSAAGAKRRVVDFMDGVIITARGCGDLASLTIPHLSSEDYSTLITELNRAIRALQAFAAEIKKGHGA